MNDETIKALGVTAELMGASLSKPAVAMMISDLSEYPDAHLLAALKRLRTEGSRFNTSEIIKRLPQMWPGADEAWARFPREEHESGCVCSEMLEAWGIARNARDQIAARMAFKEAYTRLVQAATAAGAKPVWTLSMGTDPDLREQAAIAAVQRGQLSPARAQVYLPHLEPTELTALAAGAPATALLQGPRADDAQSQANTRRLQSLLAQINAPDTDPPL